MLGRLPIFLSLYSQIVNSLNTIRHILNLSEVYNGIYELLLHTCVRVYTFNRQWGWLKETFVFGLHIIQCVFLDNTL